MRQDQHALERAGPNSTSHSRAGRVEAHADLESARASLSSLAVDCPERTPQMRKVDKQAPSYKLTFDDAVEIWIRYWNGEYQNRIAASYDVNSARVSEVLKETVHVGSRKAALHKHKFCA